MTILTDGTHLVSTKSEQELHDFAHKMGLRREWYQNKNGAARHPHYDLTTAQAVRRAIDKGALKVGEQELMKRAWWRNG